MVQLADGLLDLGHLFVDAEISALAMLPVPVIVEAESLHFGDCRRSILLLGRERFVALLLFIK